MSGGFTIEEYTVRLHRAQELMHRHRLGSILLTREPDIRYFSGFMTRFFESPCRPWFLIVPSTGDPIAVIPSIGAEAMRATWISDIRTWSAPAPEDDGITLLSDVLREVGGLVGIPSRQGTYVRMPLSSFAKLRDCSGLNFTNDFGIVADLRAIKSKAEIERISNSCSVAGRAFSRIGEIAGEGMKLDRIFRDFQRILLEEGADWIPYLAGSSDQEGYYDIISPAKDRQLKYGDVLMLDTGAIKSGYFCDFDRNFAIGNASAHTKAAHARLIDATHAGLEIARPGTAVCEIWKVMADIVGCDGETGRLGHGLGMELTEGISITPQNRTKLQPGMVIALEPGTQVVSGKIMIHEENIVITEEKPIILSPLAGPELSVI